MSRTTVNQILLALTLALSVGACTPYGTYPPLSGTVQVSKPSFAPFPQLMADSIAHCYETYDPGAEMVFNLPEGTPAPVYGQVMKRLEGSRPMREWDGRACHVDSIRVRGLDAEVDVIFPRADGLHDLITIHFHKDVLSGYAIDSTRIWRVRIDPPPPYYVPPPEDEEVIVVQPVDS
jgi:hypothetical protein